MHVFCAFSEVLDLLYYTYVVKLRDERRAVPKCYSRTVEKVKWPPQAVHCAPSTTRVLSFKAEV